MDECTSRGLMVDGDGGRGIWMKQGVLSPSAFRLLGFPLPCRHLDFPTRSWFEKRKRRLRCYDEERRIVGIVYDGMQRRREGEGAWKEPR